jgi:NDP-sugar pyrophosphorylase family protein
VLTTLDYAALVESHQQSGAALTIASYPRHVKIDLGVLETNADGFLTDYREKPEMDYAVSMGVYIYDPRVLHLIEPGKYLDFPTLVLRLLDNGEKVGTYPFKGYWLDIGQHDDYAKAQEQFAAHRDEFHLD